MTLATMRVQLRYLTEVNSLAAKARMLKSFDTAELRAVMTWAYDPYRIFGVPVEYKEAVFYVRGEAVKLGTEDRSWADAELLLNSLASKALTGGEAAEAVAEFLADAKPQAVALMAGILNKDLGLGVGPKTINKAFPDLLAIFEPALALLSRDYPATFPAFAEVKYDGERCHCLISERDGVTLLSREGKEIQGQEALKRDLWRFFPKNVMVDGELMNGRFGTRLKDNAPFVAFDILALEEFRQRGVSVPFEARRAYLEAQCEAAASNIIQLSRGFVVDTQEEADTFFMEVVGNGGEGIMLKKLDQPYHFGRKTNWLKVKPVETADLPIVNYFDGRKGNEGLLGGVVVEHKGVTTEVGSGFSLAERERWAGAKALELVGKVAEVRYEKLTPYGALLFPVWVRLREDKSREDC